MSSNNLPKQSDVKEVSDLLKRLKKLEDILMFDDEDPDWPCQEVGPTKKIKKCLISK